MSFWKAEQLLALATLVAARHAGVTLDDVIDRFSVSKRTAQRMLRALEAQFPDTAVATDGEGRKRWRLPSAPLRDLMTLSAEELAALDLAVETLKRSGLAVEADDLLGLREKVMALVRKGSPRARVLVSGSIARLSPRSPRRSKRVESSRSPISLAESQSRDRVAWLPMAF